MLNHSCDAGLRPLEARVRRAPSERPGGTALRPPGTPAWPLPSPPAPPPPCRPEAAPGSLRISGLHRRGRPSPGPPCPAVAWPHRPPLSSLRARLPSGAGTVSSEPPGVPGGGGFAESQRRGSQSPRLSSGPPGKGRWPHAEGAPRPESSGLGPGQNGAAASPSPSTKEENGNQGGQEPAGGARRPAPPRAPPPALLGLGRCRGEAGEWEGVKRRRPRGPPALRTPLPPSPHVPQHRPAPQSPAAEAPASPGGRAPASTRPAAPASPAPPSRCPRSIPV